VSLWSARAMDRAAIERVALPVLIALLGAVVVLNLISFLFGRAPVDTLALAFHGTWGTPYGVGQVLFKATPLIFTGLAFELAFRAGLFNIGAEGQLAMGSLVGAWVATLLPATLPAVVLVPLALAAAMVAGALVAAIPAVMRAKLGVHEIITAIMTNRIVDVLLPFVLVTILGSATLRTADVPAGAAMPRFDGLLPVLKGSAMSFAFLLAVVVAVGLGLWMKRSRVGRQMKWIGSGAEACEAEGVPVARRLMQAMILSGAVAGAGMSATVLGYKGYYELGLGAGAGWTGIAVALLGRGSAVGIVLAAILFGTLQQAGLAINATVPKEAMTVLEAVVIVAVAVSSRLAQPEGRGAAT
jgi:ABC-type uncharacterized transport system permease subunit